MIYGQSPIDGDLTVESFSRSLPMNSEKTVRLRSIIGHHVYGHTGFFMTPEFAENLAHQLLEEAAKAREYNERLAARRREIEERIKQSGCGCDICASNYQSKGAAQ